MISENPEADDIEVSLVFTDDSHIEKLNKQYLGREGATDVISFYLDDERTPDGKLILGDIVISVDTAERQAQEQGHSFTEELEMLIVHGMLHLLGYDHEKKETFAGNKTQAKRKLLPQIGLKVKKFPFKKVPFSDDESEIFWSKQNSLLKAFKTRKR